MKEAQNNRAETKRADLVQDELKFEELETIAGGKFLSNSHFAYQLAIGGSRLTWGELNPQPLPPRYANFHG